jgi:hypothetical protein
MIQYDVIYRIQEIGRQKSEILDWIAPSEEIRNHFMKGINVGSKTIHIYHFNKTTKQISLSIRSKK